jgi:hypothetical protein
MKKKTAKMPDRLEWDFSQIPDDQIADAALYEYARTSDKLRTSISAWLSTKLTGGTLAELLLDEARKNNRRALNSVFYDHVYSGLKATLNNEALLEIVRELPWFPKPYQLCGISPLKIIYPLGKDRPKNMPPFSRIRITPMSKVADRVADAEQHLKISGSEFIRTAWPSDYRLEIRWDKFTTKEILSDFRRWLAADSKNHPELKQRGKPSQISPHTLAWLAALRISRAGLSYTEAQKHFDLVKHHPKYADKSGWCDAISNAERIIARLEDGKPIVGL